MDTLLEKFAKLGCDNAPGQEGRQKAAALEAILRHQTGRSFAFREAMTQNVAVFRVVAHDFSGKRHE